MFYPMCRSRLLDGRLLVPRLFSTSCEKVKKPSQKAKVEKPQITFSADVTESTPDLHELAQFLSRCLIRGGIKSAVVSDFGKKPLVEQFKKNDDLGIEYCVVMKRKTLVDGLLGLRHIESTLQEQVHTSMLKRYLTFIFRPTAQQQP